MGLRISQLCGRHVGDMHHPRYNTCDELRIELADYVVQTVAQPLRTLSTSSASSASSASKIYIHRNFGNNDELYNYCNGVSFPIILY